MRIVRKAEEMEKLFIIASKEAEKSFNDPSVFIEKYIENPKHIEFQILGDTKGNVIHLGEGNVRFKGNIKSFSKKHHLAHLMRSCERKWVIWQSRLPKLSIIIQPVLWNFYLIRRKISISWK